MKQSIVVLLLLFCITSAEEPANEGINTHTYWESYTPTKKELKIINAVQKRYKSYFDSTFPNYTTQSPVSLKEEIAYRYLIIHGTEFEKQCAMRELTHLKETEPYFMFVPFLNESVPQLDNCVQGYLDNPTPLYINNKPKLKPKHPLSYYASQALRASIASAPCIGREIDKSTIINWYDKNRDKRRSFDRLARYLSSLNDREVHRELEKIYSETPSLYIELLLQDSALRFRNIHEASLIISRISLSDSLKSEYFDYAYCNKPINSWGRLGGSRFLQKESLIYKHVKDIYGETPQCFLHSWREQVDSGKVVEELYDQTIAFFPDSAFQIRYKTAKAMSGDRYLYPLIEHHLDNDSAWQMVKEFYLRSYNLRFNTSYLEKRMKYRDSLQTHIGSGEKWDSILVLIAEKDIRNSQIKSRNFKVSSILNAVANAQGYETKRRLTDLLNSADYTHLLSDEIAGLVIALEKDGVIVQGAEYFKQFNESWGKGWHSRYEENKSKTDKVLPAFMVQLNRWITE